MHDDFTASRELPEDAALLIQETIGRNETKALRSIGILIPFHLVEAHARHLNPPPRPPWYHFWRRPPPVTGLERQQATVDLIQLAARISEAAA